MKKRMVIVLLSLVLCMFATFAIHVGILKNALKKSEELISLRNFDENGVEYIVDSDIAIDIAKKVWAERHGKLSNMPYIYSSRLIDNKYWVVEGVNIFMDFFGISCGGGPYIILEKTGKVLFLGETG